MAVHQQHIASLASIQHFAIKGRLGVITKPKGFSGRISWHHTNKQDNVDMYSPFGSKVASLVRTAHQVTLTQKKDGRVITAKDTETLTQDALGWRLPLSGLSDWALGKPTNEPIDASTWDSHGRLTALKQSGWDIQYSRYTEIGGYSLPNKVVLKSDKVTLKLLVEQWSGL